MQSSLRLRTAHATLRALNVEFDRVRSTVSNEDLARLRLSFFRTALSSVISSNSQDGRDANRGRSHTFDSASALPVFDCLAEAVSSFPSVDFTPVYDLLDAREAFLSYPNFVDTSSLADFAAAPHKPLLKLHADLLHAVTLNNQPSLVASPIPPSVTEAIEPASVAIGLGILLRAVPVHANSRLTYMPRGLLSTSNLLTTNEASRPVFQGVALTAADAASNALSLVRTLPRALRPAFWPVHLSSLYLNRLSRVNYDPFDSSLVAGLRTTWHLAVQLRLLRAKIFAS